MAPPRDTALRRQEDGERLARVEERSVFIAQTLGEIKKQGAVQHDAMVQTLKELREWKQKEHEEINTRIGKVENRQAYFSGVAAVAGVVFAAAWDRVKAMF